MTHNEIFFFFFWLKKEKKKWPLLRVDAVLCKCIIPWLSLSHTVFSKLKGNFSSIPDCIGAPSETSWMSRKLDPKLLCRARQSSDRKPAMKRDKQRRRQLHHNRLQAGQTSNWWTKKFCQHTSTYGRSRLDHRRRGEDFRLRTGIQGLNGNNMELKFKLAYKLSCII